MDSASKQALQASLVRSHRNLAILTEQQAQYGLEAPLRLLNQIDEEKERIADIEARLSGQVYEPDLASQYFSRATQALLLGDMWEAQRYYKMTLDIAPYYPRAAEMLAQVKSFKPKFYSGSAEILCPNAAPSQNTYLETLMVRAGAIIGILIHSLLLWIVSVSLIVYHLSLAAIDRSKFNKKAAPDGAAFFVPLTPQTANQPLSLSAAAGPAS